MSAKESNKTGAKKEKRRAPEEKKERFVRTVVGTVCLFVAVCLCLEKSSRTRKELN